MPFFQQGCDCGMTPSGMAVCNRWTGLVDWTTGLDYWTDVDLKRACAHEWHHVVLHVLQCKFVRMHQHNSLVLFIFCLEELPSLLCCSNGDKERSCVGIFRSQKSKSSPIQLSSDSSDGEDDCFCRKAAVSVTVSPSIGHGLIASPQKL